MPSSFVRLSYLICFEFIGNELAFTEFIISVFKLYFSWLSLRFLMIFEFLEADEL